MWSQQHSSKMVALDIRQSCLNSKTKYGNLLLHSILCQTWAPFGFLKYLILVFYKWIGFPKMMQISLFGLTGWLSSWFWKLKMFVHCSKGWNIGRLFILEVHKGADQEELSSIRRQLHPQTFPKAQTRFMKPDNQTIWLCITCMLKKIFVASILLGICQF